MENTIAKAWNFTSFQLCFRQLPIIEEETYIALAQGFFVPHFDNIDPCGCEVNDFLTVVNILNFLLFRYFLPLVKWPEFSILCLPKMLIRSIGRFSKWINTSLRSSNTNRNRAISDLCKRCENSTNLRILILIWRMAHWFWKRGSFKQFYEFFTISLLSPIENKYHAFKQIWIHFSQKRFLLHVCLIEIFLIL